MAVTAREAAEKLKGKRVGRDVFELTPEVRKEIKRRDKVEKDARGAKIRVK